jgi:hypothetical protein
LVPFFSGHSRAAAGPDQAWKRRAKSLARLFIAAAALCVVATPPRATERETRVLILNGTNPTLPASLLHDAAMREALAKSTTHRFQFFSEAIDARRFALADFEQEFLALLRKKYEGITFDVVVPESEPALDFVRRYTAVRLSVE